MADLAVIKLEPRSDVGSVQWGNYTSPACLPHHLQEAQESLQCQTAGWAVTTKGKGSLRSAVLGHSVSLQSPANCLQNLQDQSSVEASQVLCSSSRCNRFVVGPVFCRAENSDRYYVASLPTGGSDWCSAGASTSLAHYADWLERTIQYLHPSYTSQVTDHHPQTAVKVETPPVTEAEDNNCTPNPCGDHALCWNGEGRSFLCTCEADHPHGNPYSGCVVCLYDNQCGPGQECKEERCVATGGEGDHPVPPGYVQVGTEHYYISDKPLSWSLAQYSCMNREGEQNISSQSPHT